MYKAVRVMTSVLLASTMIALAGCGAPTSTTVSGPSDSTPARTAANATITIYCNPVIGNDIPDIITAFEKENTDIKVSFVELPSNTSQKNQTLSTILQAKDSSMDVFMLDCTWPQMYISAGWLESLDDVVSAEERAKYLPGALEANLGYDDKLYALPQNVGTGALLYRKDLLDKYGYQPPKTWDELAEQAKVIMVKEPTLTSGFTSAWKQYEGLTCCALEFIWAYGGDVLDESGKVIFNSTETAAGLQRMYDLMAKDKITDVGINGYTWADSQVQFNSGNSIFMRDWGMAYPKSQSPENSKVVDMVGLAPLPSGPNGNYSTLGGWSVGVSSFSKNKDAAKRFVKFFASYDAMKITAIQRGSDPAIAEVYADADVTKAMPHFALMTEAANNTKSRPKTAYYEELSGVIQQGVGSIMAGQTTVQQALDSMTPQIEEIMNR